MAAVRDVNDFNAILPGWVESINAAFDLRLRISDGQCSFTTRDGVDILLSPSSLLASLFLSATVGTVPTGSPELLERLMARNLFARDTQGGWIAFEPVERKAVLQLRWDRYPVAAFEEFLLLLRNFVEVAEAIARELKRAPSDAPPPPLPYNAMLRI